MIEFISQPWPWYVAGPMIVLVMYLLLYFGGRFGVSSTMRTMCAAAGGGKHAALFNYNWKEGIWNLVFVGGALIGGFIASTWLASGEPLDLAAATHSDMQALGITVGDQYLPQELFSWDNLLSLPGIILMVLGGFLVGFGTRYAGGCTSGHAISGLSNLQWPSLLAVVGFFAGGLLMTHLLLPLILG